MTPFGARMREMRAARAVTLTEMAAAIGVSPAYLSALEHGRRGAPSWYLVQRIISYFNVIWDEAEELCKLAQASGPRVKIDTGGLSPEATTFCHLLSRHVGALTREDFAAMTEIIERASDRREETSGPTPQRSERP